MADEDNLTTEDMALIAAMSKADGGGGFAAPTDPKHNVFSFFDNVAKANDTTKLGNLSIEELGNPKYPLRTYKNVVIMSKHVSDFPEIGDMFSLEGESLTATSLSKEALLIRLAVTQKRELADVTKPKKENKGWFGRRKEEGESKV